MNSTTTLKINGITYNVTATSKMDTVSGPAVDFTLVNPRGRGVQYGLVMWEGGRVSPLINLRSGATERVWEVVA